MIRPFRLTAVRHRMQRWRWLPRRAADLECVPEGWSRGAQDQKIKGWDVPTVVAAQQARLQAWREVVQSDRPLGASTSTGCIPSDLERHNTLVSYAYVAALAAHGQERMSLLDWGGGLGQYGWLTAGVLPGVTIDYHCQDVSHQVAVGRELQPLAHFHEVGDVLPEGHFDLVLASGALQYVQAWREALAELANKSRRYLFVTRLPVVLDAPSYVVLQRAYCHGYDTEFLGWRLQRQEFLEEAQRQGLSLVREFLIGEKEWARHAPRPAEGRGFLFRVPASTEPGVFVAPQPNFDPGR